MTITREKRKATRPSAKGYKRKESDSSEEESQGGPFVAEPEMSLADNCQQFPSPSTRRRRRDPVHQVAQDSPDCATRDSAASSDEVGSGGRLRRRRRTLRRSAVLEEQNSDEKMQDNRKRKVRTSGFRRVKRAAAVSDGSSESFSIKEKKRPISEPKAKSRTAKRHLRENGAEKIKEEINLSEEGKELDKYVVSKDAYGSQRGDLFLTDNEVENINTILATRADGAWRFISTDLAKKEEKVPKPKVKSQKKGSTVSTQKKSRTKKPSIEEKPPPKAGPINRISLIKGVPDWVRRWYHIMFSFCQLSVSQPFLEDMPTNDPDYNKYLEDIFPAHHVSLRTILGKLENNLYELPLHVFNDVYMVWICALRHHPPGSSEWRMAQNASEQFFIHVANQPFKDDFSVPPVAKQSSPQNAQKNINQKATMETMKMLKQILRSSNVKTATDPNPSYSSGTSSNIGRAKARSKKSKKPNSKNLSRAELEEFGNLLGVMQQDDHMEMYETFKLRARWKEGEGGEIELDERDTSATVLRDMVEWAKGKVANRGIDLSVATKSQEPQDTPLSDTESSTHTHPVQKLTEISMGMD
eukprot:GHVP01067160.1.p1 GENE.GHVP01067160.1~~GHVP01067160.1.p1  ORF type:complete len:583 (+),score=109.38 GHVP01067160.1:27-1775(+)